MVQEAGITSSSSAVESPLPTAASILLGLGVISERPDSRSSLYTIHEVSREQSPVDTLGATSLAASVVNPVYIQNGT